MEIRVDGQLLRQVDTFKYLGFLLTSNASPTEHRVRVTERAKAAAASIASIIRKLNIIDFGRLRNYLSCFVESQFYGIEIMPLNVLESVNSARSAFIRMVFDLPRSASHDLAVILLDAKPVEVLMLQRILRLVRSVQRHDFVFVRDALEIDRCEPHSSCEAF